MFEPPYERYEGLRVRDKISSLKATIVSVMLWPIIDVEWSDGSKGRWPVQGFELVDEKLLISNEPLPLPG